MINKTIVFLISILITLFSSAFAQEAIKTQHTFSNRPISFIFQSKEQQQALTTPEKNNLYLEIINNILLFTREAEGHQHLLEAHFEISFNKNNTKENLNNLIIKTFHLENNQEVMVRHFKIITLQIINKKLCVLSFCPDFMENKNQNIYDIYNVSFDKDNNILKRIIILQQIDSALNADFKTFQFKEGKLFEYQNYTNKKPAISTCNTFVYNSNGQKIFLTKFQSSKSYNEKGYITNETTTTTTYSYRKNPLDFKKIYNLQLDYHGNIQYLDLIINSERTPTSKESNNFEIAFTRNSQGLPLKKDILEYKILEGKKDYTQGKMIEYLIDENQRTKHIKTSTYNIKSYPENAEEKQKVLQKIHYMWNYDFDQNNNVLYKKELDTTFVHTAQGSSQTLHSLKEIYFERSSSKSELEKILMHYYSYDASGTLTIKRSLDIQILEIMPSGEPSVIKLKITFPGDPSFKYEQIYYQDCSYLLHAAIKGNLFKTKQDDTFITQIISISPDGKNINCKVINILE